MRVSLRWLSSIRASIFGRSGKGADHVCRQHLRERRIERQAAALDELQHRDRNERLHGAPAWKRSPGRIGTARPRGQGPQRRPAAEFRAAHVPDPYQGVYARVVQRDAQYLLELTRHGRARSAAPIGPPVSWRVARFAQAR